MWMKCKVSSSMLLLTSFESSSLPYKNKSVVDFNNCSYAAEPLAKRPRRWISKWRAQQQRFLHVLNTVTVWAHCVCSGPEPMLELWKFILLRPTLTSERYNRPIGLWIPKADFPGGGGNLSYFVSSVLYRIRYIITQTLLSLSVHHNGIYGVPRW